MPYIVAEMSASHNGSLKTALKIIETAKACGADAIKLQTFEPEQLCADKKFTIRRGAWSGKKLIDIYKQGHTPKKWHPQLFEYAESVGLDCFSTPFHPDDVDFLEDLNCPKYKISSFEIINLRLIDRVAETRKPMIISTGMANLRDISQAVICATRNYTEDRVKDVTLLHCVSEYPTNPGLVNLSRMLRIRDEFMLSVGLSDHSAGSQVAIMAAMLGAEIIEKHLCLDRAGLDGSFASMPKPFRAMCKAVKNVDTVMGSGQINQGTAYSNLRPSLYYGRDIKQGDTLSEEDIIIARPYNGVHPSTMPYYIGRTLEHDVKKYDPLQ